MSREPSLEDWFRHEGVPHLARQFDPREDVLTRLRPALLVLFVLALALVLRPEWPAGPAPPRRWGVCWRRSPAWAC